MNDFRKIKAWQRAHTLLLDIYQLSAAFPAHERYTLTSQLRRAALSVPTNLAEGAGRFARGDFRRFVDYAAGSSKEVEYLLMTAADLRYAPSDAIDPLLNELDEIQRMLRGLHSSLSKTQT